MSSLFARLAMRPAAKQAAAASLRRWPGIPAVASALSTCARTAATTAPAAVAWTGAASGGQHRAMSTGPSHDDDKPTLEMAKSMPDSCVGMSNELIVTMCAAGDLSARRERLTRHIMAVDGCDWDEANEAVEQICQENLAHSSLLMLPYKIGMATGAISVPLSVLLVFDENTALWFNKQYVTMDIPPDSDLDTWLEVGSWTWSWMEPVMGTASFVLLALQFSRAQMINISLRPFTGYIKRRRLDTVQANHTQYEGVILRDFLRSHSFLHA